VAFGAVGTGIQSPPAQLLGTMNAITQKYIVPSVGDTTFKPSPAFWAMTKKGIKQQGGEIVYAEITQEEMTGGAYFGDQMLNTAVVDSIQPATQVWRSYYQSVSIPTLDIILNRGQAGILPLVRTKFQIACGSMLQKLSRAMWHTSPQNTSIDIDDLVSWVQTSNNVIAGIDRSQAANAFWLPGPAVANGGTPLTLTNAEKAYQGDVFGYDEPDLMLIDGTTAGVFSGFKGQFTPLIRFTNEDQDKEALQAGFRYHFMFGNAVVMPERFAPANTAWLFNTKYLYPMFHLDDYFTVDPFVKPSNQRVVVTQIFLTWQLINQSPRMSSVITGV
jgi:hypothetical protein